MTLSQFGLLLHERFTYEYNFLDAWLLDIRFEGEHPFRRECHYPRCVAGSRRGSLIFASKSDGRNTTYFPVFSGDQSVTR